jgi:hypothetical protein
MGGKQPPGFGGIKSAVQELLFMIVITVKGVADTGKMVGTGGREILLPPVLL